MSAEMRPLGERVEAVRLALSTDLFQDGLLRAMVAREADALLLEQQAEIEKIKANANLEIHRLRQEALKLEDNRASLRRALEAARVDAERYRTWRDGCVHETSKIARLLANCVWPSDYDAAIDLARARGEGNADE